MPVYYNGEKVTNALPITKLQSKIVTENETTVTPDVGYNGLSSVTVNVPTGDYNINSEILEDGTQRMVVSLAAENTPIQINIPEEEQEEFSSIYTFRVGHYVFFSISLKNASGLRGSGKLYRQDIFTGEQIVITDRGRGV